MTGHQLGSWTLYQRERDRKRADHHFARPPASTSVVYDEILHDLTQFIKKKLLRSTEAATGS
jgi:hypothetical protein